MREVPREDIVRGIDREETPEEREVVDARVRARQELEKAAAPIAEQMRKLFPGEGKRVWFDFGKIDPEKLGTFIAALEVAKQQVEALQANIAIEQAAIDAIDATERGKRMTKLREDMEDIENKYGDVISRFMPKSRNETSPQSDLYSIDFEPVTPDISSGFVSDEDKERYKNVIGTFQIIADKYSENYYGQEPEGTIEVSLDPSGTIVGKIAESGSGLDATFKDGFVRLLKSL